MQIEKERAQMDRKYTGNIVKSQYDVDARAKGRNGWKPKLENLKLNAYRSRFQSWREGESPNG